MFVAVTDPLPPYNIVSYNCTAVYLLYYRTAGFLQFLSIATNDMSISVFVFFFGTYVYLSVRSLYLGMGLLRLDTCLFSLSI